MKKLLLLLLFGFSAIGADKPKTEFDKDGNILVRVNGADKPIPSYGMLEGFGVGGVKIQIIIPQLTESGIGKKDQEIISDQVELELRRAGFKIIPKDKKTKADFFNISVKVALGVKDDIWYLLDAKVSRRVTFKANGKEYYAYANGASFHSQCSRSDVKEEAKDLTKRFITSWHKTRANQWDAGVNPKKKED